ncbi:MAG: hypothetical protein U0836_01525 [Pirellulales bacterium]
MQRPDAESSLVLWIGEVGSPEFSRIYDELASVVAVEVCASPAVALGRLAACSEEPVLLLVAQRFPDEFPAAAIEPLRRRLPLTRCLALAGPWCEGEPRSGQPLPGAMRLYWHQWTAQTLHDLRKLLAGEIGVWSLPATTSEEDRLAVGLMKAEATGPAGLGPVCIVAHDREAAAALADLLAAAKVSSVWRRTSCAVSGVTATIVDLARGDEEEWRLLAEIASAEAGPVLALLGFPRPEDAERAAWLGAAKLLSKPLCAADLLAALQNAMSAT